MACATCRLRGARSYLSEVTPAQRQPGFREYQVLAEGSATARAPRKPEALRPAMV